MQILMISLGTAGDVLPLVGWGAALRARGDDVSILCNGYYGPAVRHEGLNLIELYPAEKHHEILNSRNLASRRKSLRAFADRLVAEMQHIYEIIADVHVPGKTVLVAQGWAIGARIAQEKLGLPLATVHLQPLCFRSVHQLRPILRPLARGIHRTIDEFVDRRLIGPSINAYRSRLGLPPVRRILREWWHSPQLVLGFFPEWFAAPQPDWAPQTRLCGFQFYDKCGEFDQQKRLDAFLAAGEPPIVFSQCSAVRYGAGYFAASVEAARHAGRRAILLTPDRDRIPASLPDSAAHFDYVPLRILLPRAAAHVHHGGMGMTAQTLAAGVPHLVVPQMLDQPDNARRLCRLGVAGRIRPANYRPRQIAHELRRLLESPQVARRCREYAQRCAEIDAFENATRALDEMCGATSTKDPDGRPAVCVT